MNEREENIQRRMGMMREEDEEGRRKRRMKMKIKG